MGDTEFKITQKAMDLLKQKYCLIKVDGKIMGLSYFNIVPLFNKGKDYLLDPRNYTNLYGKNIGFTAKIYRDQLTRDFKLCCYGAKNPEKVHIGWTTMASVPGIPDGRVVLMTYPEGAKFEKVAKNHKISLPDNQYIETTSQEIREAIPQGKIKVPMVNTMRYNQGEEAKIADFLIARGVNVADFNELMDGK